MNKLYYSHEAISDLDEIWAYIYAELKNPSAAQNTVNRILDSIEMLESFQEMGPLLSSLSKLETDYRFLVCGDYLAFYRVKEEGVYIDRVLNGRRDYLRILFGDLVPDATS
ncbi:MAG: type II toxin-antitoxin system RelE/ParE family toxin [Clostridiales bacterium]|nr:type II toxin-antitoxin system RelE/ParE family toxin [Clostridiales bacterium]